MWRVTLGLPDSCEVGATGTVGTPIFKVIVFFCWVSMHITIDVCVCIIDVPLGYACRPTLHVSLV